MVEITASPKHFAQHFNEKVPGAWRKLTIADVFKLTELGLVKRHGYYSPSQDLETVRAILAYEEWRQRQKEPTPIPEAQSKAPRLCKGCGQPLPPAPEGKHGRPRAYCDTCEPMRVRLRYRKWRSARRQQKPPTETSLCMMNVNLARKEVSDDANAKAPD